MDIPQALSALEQLASSTSTSSSGPLTTLLDEHFTNAKTSLLSGQDPKTVITDLQKAVIKSKKDVEKGLKGWYGALGGLGKAVDKVCTDVSFTGFLCLELFYDWGNRGWLCQSLSCV